MFSQNISKPSKLHWRQFCLAWLFLLAPLQAISANEQAPQGSGAWIQLANLKQQSETYFLNADIKYQLSSQTREALNNGITLTFNVKLSLSQQRKWLWGEHLYSVKLPYTIKYHTLAGTYQVSDLTSQRQQSFASLASALYALGQLKEVPLHKTVSERLTTPTHATASLSASLNIEALPLPMRLTAYLTPAWHLNSDKYLWHLK